MKERSVKQSRRFSTTDSLLPANQKTWVQEQTLHQYNQKLLTVREGNKSDQNSQKKEKMLELQNGRESSEKILQQFPKTPKVMFIEQHQKIIKEQSQEESFKTSNKQLDINERKKMIKHNIYQNQLYILSQKQKDYRQIKKKLEDLVQQKLGDAARIKEQDITIKQLEEKERQVQQKINDITESMNKNYQKVDKSQEQFVNLSYMKELINSSTLEIIKKQHDLVIKMSLLLSYVMTIFICAILFNWIKE